MPQYTSSEVTAGYNTIRFKVPMKPIFFGAYVNLLRFKSGLLDLGCLRPFSYLFFAIENRISRFESGSFPRAVKTTLSRDYDVVNC